MSSAFFFTISLVSALAGAVIEHYFDHKTWAKKWSFALIIGGVVGMTGSYFVDIGETKETIDRIENNQSAILRDRNHMLLTKDLIDGSYEDVKGLFVLVHSTFFEGDKWSSRIININRGLSDAIASHAVGALTNEELILALDQLSMEYGEAGRRNSHEVIEDMADAMNCLTENFEDWEQWAGGLFDIREKIRDLESNGEPVPDNLAHQLKKQESRRGAIKRKCKVHN